MNLTTTYVCPVPGCGWEHQAPVPVLPAEAGVVADPESFHRWITDATRATDHTLGQHMRAHFLVADPDGTPVTSTIPDPIPVNRLRAQDDTPLLIPGDGAAALILVREDSADVVGRCTPEVLADALRKIAASLDGETL